MYLWLTLSPFYRFYRLWNNSSKYGSLFFHPLTQFTTVPSFRLCPFEALIKPSKLITSTYSAPLPHHPKSLRDRDRQRTQKERKQLSLASASQNKNNQNRKNPKHQSSRVSLYSLAGSMRLQAHEIAPCSPPLSMAPVANKFQPQLFSVMTHCGLFGLHH